MTANNSNEGANTGPENKNGDESKEIKEFVDKNTPKSKKESTLYYFYTTGCGFCKKAEPIVDELNKEGKYEILKLDLAEKDNQGLNKELKEKYKGQCGTPWFIDAETGNQVCGFREKDVIEKWASGEEIPAPPRPKGPIPKPPFYGASKKEETTWKKEYEKWLEENSHLPKTQTADEILSRPRPKSDPPRPPAPNSNDEQLNEWVKEYDKWKDENTHLPNLQPGSVLVNRFKQQGQPGQPGQPGQLPPGAPVGLNPDQNARITRLEQKMDKLIKHLGVK